MLKKKSETTSNTPSTTLKLQTRLQLKLPAQQNQENGLESSRTHKSKYTSTSKLTQSQLHRVLSQEDLRKR